jgi:hypothetical protein
MTKFYTMFLALAMLVATAFSALAVEVPIDLTGVTLDTTPVKAAALIVIGGLVVLWTIRKLIKLFNRS